MNARETDPEGCSNNDLRSALDAYRNADLDYDSWIKVGLALKDAARSGLVSDAEGRDLWLWWSAQSAKDDPTLSAKKWDSFDPRQIGVRTIFWLARAAGWRGGPAKTKAGAAPAPAEVDAIIEAIVDRWREQFQPAHLKSDGFWSLSKNALVRKGGVNPDAAMFRALLPFAPVENGLPKTNAIPRLYSSWASFAWGELLNRLPDEADYTAHDAHEPFLLTMERMLCSMVSCVVKGSDIPEPKTLASWLAQITIDTMARPGWQQLRTYASWGRRIPPLEPSGATLEAALKPVLATQIPRAPKEIAEMTPKMLTVLAKRHGIGRGETLRISGTEFRATVINADFVAACLAGDIFATMTQEQYIAWRAAKKGAEE